MVAVHEEHLRRPRTVGLAAKFLVALGFGVALFLLGGHAAHAADGPLGSVRHRISGVTERATSRVVEVSAPRDVDRPLRVLPHGDTQVATVALRPRHVEVAAPAVPAPVPPIRVEVPALLPSVPTVDVATVAGPAVHHAPIEAHPAVHHASLVATIRSVVTPHAEPKGAHHAAKGTAPAPQRQPTRPPVDRPSGDVPATAASATGLALAVLGTLGRKAPSVGGQPLHTVVRRVPIAPAFEPSFTPD